MDDKVALLGFGCDVHSSFLRGAANAPPLVSNALIVKDRLGLTISKTLLRK